MPPFHELDKLCVRIDKVAYLPELEAPRDRPYPYVYFITIENHTNETITIKGRKWVVTDEKGNRTVVEGDGVVGKFPKLKPGASFSYNSYHAVGCDSVAEGAFIGVNEAGEAVIARIPPFAMKVPR